MLIGVASAADLRVESTSLSADRELLTVMGSLAQGHEVAGSVPLLSVMRDTSGDRLRSVWVLTSPRPSVAQRALAAVPFNYWRSPISGNPNKPPSVLLDLGRTHRPVWNSVAASLTQVLALDPSGTWVRSSSRSYRNHASDNRATRLASALAVVTQLEEHPESRGPLRDSDLRELRARLSLAEREFGGLVDSDRIPQAYYKERQRSEETRGHNWELLRQRAEANGLYFEPLGSNGVMTHALLWVDRHDALVSARKFDDKFLGIASPFGDRRVTEWEGYANNGRVPLALYALDYPKVPFLLVDFRSPMGPRHREMLRRGISDTVSGVLGVSKWGNWGYLAGAWSWDFVRSRHGAAQNREARVKAYAAVRQWLALDPSVDADLRAELQSRLEELDVNPLNESVFEHAQIARLQYSALLKSISGRAN